MSDKKPLWCAVTRGKTDRWSKIAHAVAQPLDYAIASENRALCGIQVRIRGVWDSVDRVLVAKLKPCQNCMRSRVWL